MFEPSKDLFRKSALDKLSSPEQLDVMLQVTSPMGWISLAGLGIVLAFALVWSIVGKIPITVDGQGILIRGAEVFDVTAEAQGRIQELTVKAGDRIQAGQVIVRFDQPELRLKIENTKAQLEQIEGQSRNLKSRGGSLQSQYQAQARELREKIAVQEGLVKKGILTKSTLMRTKEQLANTEQMITQTQMTQSGEELRVDDLKRQITEMEGRLGSTTELKSPYAGRILEVTAASGSLVAPGQRILTLEPLTGALETVLYIPAGEGKKVRPGMAVRIAPSTVKAEEYGFLLGKVKTVSDFPVTPEGLRRVLRNDKLAEELIGKSAPLEVVATLEPDSATPSGFKWSSSKGPPTQIFSGTLSKGTVVVEDRRPISYVLPIVKKTLGTS
ncbi:MAG TPA: NHLP bacteriocin system secretion protein [Thermoanaerobaculia bacterium]|nr:NHLP bacteriocin system secretion protein [Thermoanaerobaculia bacterium]